MREIVGSSRVDRLALEVDTRLNDLMLDMLGDESLSPEAASRFIIRSYQQGVEDVITLEDPESIYRDFGYRPPTPESRGMPPWIDDRNGSPTDEEIIHFFEKSWVCIIDEVCHQPEFIASGMRSAYGLGYSYSYAVSRHGAY